MLLSVTSLILKESGRDCSRSFWKRPGKHSELIPKRGVLLGTENEEQGIYTRPSTLHLVTLRDLRLQHHSLQGLRIL